MTALDSERWRRMQPLLDDALTLPPDERDDWLDRVCAGDPELRAMFDRVLRADAQAGGFLDTPLSPFPEIVLDDFAGGGVSEFRGLSALPCFGGWAQAAWVSSTQCMTGSAVT